MIAFEVRKNGKRICIAGADDMAVLSADITAHGKLGKKTIPRRPNDVTQINYSVGGLIPRPNGKIIYPKWKFEAPLRVGDVIEVRILEKEKVDRAKPRNAAKGKRG